MLFSTQSFPDFSVGVVVLVSLHKSSISFHMCILIPEKSSIGFPEGFPWFPLVFYCFSVDFARRVFPL